MLWKKKVSGEYFSWESFFAAVLIEETKDSYMAYTKRKINPAYLDKTMSGAILKQMGKIKREEMINDRKIILKLVEIKEQFVLMEIIYVFLTIFLYLLKCPQSLILSALRAFCFCGKPHISRSIFLYFRYQSWLKSW